MKKTLSLVCAMLLLALACTACATPSPVVADPSVVPSAMASPTAEPTVAAVEATPLADASFDTVKANGKLIIGLDDTFAPMGFHDTDGKLVGFDIDLATEVCALMGVEAVFQPIDWDAKEMELSGNKIDCIWNGMSITPERQASMSLTRGYLDNKIVIMCNPGITITSKEDLAKVNIGTQAKSSALEVLKADPIYDSIEGKIHEYGTYDEVLMDMKAGRIDVMVVDEVLGQYKNTTLGGIYTTSEVDFGQDLYAVGLRKGDLALTQELQKAIDTLITNGKAAEISNKWFGMDIVVKP